MPRPLSAPDTMPHRPPLRPEHRRRASPASVSSAGAPRKPRRRSSQGNIVVWFVKPPRRTGQSAGMGGVGRARRPPWRAARSWHRRWPKRPSTLPFSHRCSSHRSLQQDLECALQDDYIFDEHGSHANALGLCVDDDLSWLNPYGTNDALFHPTPNEQPPPSPPAPACLPESV